MFLQRFIATNKIFQLPIKSFQCFWILFFLLGTSRDLIVQAHAHIQHEHLKRCLSYFQLVCLGLTYGVFRKRWYCWITKGREDNLFMYFLCYRRRSNLNSICCLAKSFKTVCSSNMTEYIFVSWSVKLMVGIGNAARIAWPILTLFRFSI